MKTELRQGVIKRSGVVMCSVSPSSLVQFEKVIKMQSGEVTWGLDAQNKPLSLIRFRARRMSP